MGEMVTMLVLWLVVIGVMWFLLMRPQKKEQKRIQQMLASMEVGDTALTTSGFYGVTEYTLIFRRKYLKRV